MVVPSRAGVLRVKATERGERGAAAPPCRARESNGPGRRSSVTVCHEVRGSVGEGGEALRGGTVSQEASGPRPPCRPGSSAIGWGSAGGVAFSGDLYTPLALGSEDVPAVVRYRILSVALRNSDPEAVLQVAASVGICLLGRGVYDVNATGVTHEPPIALAHSCDPRHTGSHP